MHHFSKRKQTQNLQDPNSKDEGKGVWKDNFEHLLNEETVCYKEEIVFQIPFSSYKGDTMVVLFSIQRRIKKNK